MPSFPKNYFSVDQQINAIKRQFEGRFDKPCYVVGNGPSASQASLSQAEIDEGTILRANWFFLESEKRYGNRVDGFFWSIANKGLREELVKNQTEGDYDIRAFFQPFKYSESRDRFVEGDSHELQPNFDHWAIIATNPALARFMMGRPLPTQGIQMIAFAAVLGFKKIYLSGIDLYQNAASRYAWEVPESVLPHLKAKDIAGGYESDHDLEIDLHFLRTIMAEYDFELIGISDLKALSPYLDRLEQRSARDRPVPSPPSSRTYVTLADGRYTIGAMALARSLAKVSNVPLLVLHSDPHVPRMLAHVPNVTTKLVKKITNHHNPKQIRFAETLTKLRIFDLLEYERITFIDADCIVLKNIDDLFDTHGFLAAPDWGIDITPDFNSGLLAFSPSAELRNRIFSSLFDHNSSDGGDQGFLNAMLGPEVTLLPPEYNMLKRLLVHHPNLVDLADAKVLHFVGDKPWDIHQRRPEFVGLEKVWLSFLEKEDFRHEFWMNKKFIAKRWEKQTSAEKAKAPKRDEGFEKRLQTYGPFRRTIATIGDKILPSSIAKPIDRFLKKIGVL